MQNWEQSVLSSIGVSNFGPVISSRLLSEQRKPLVHNKPIAIQAQCMQVSMDQPVPCCLPSVEVCTPSMGMGC